MATRKNRILTQTPPTGGKIEEHWLPTQDLTCALPGGAILVARVSGGGHFGATWQVFRSFDDQCLMITEGNAPTAGAAKSAALAAMMHWRAQIEPDPPGTVMTILLHGAHPFADGKRVYSPVARANR
jgi:hypothetical protein